MLFAKKRPSYGYLIPNYKHKIVWHRSTVLHYRQQFVWMKRSKGTSGVVVSFPALFIEDEGGIYALSTLPLPVQIMACRLIGAKPVSEPVSAAVLVGGFYRIHRYFRRICQSCASVVPGGHPHVDVPGGHSIVACCTLKRLIRSAALKLVCRTSIGRPL